MTAIKITRGCGASGAMLEAGRVYAVPDEVSAKDADILVRMGKAETVADHALDAPAEKPARKRKAAA